MTDNQADHVRRASRGKLDVAAIFIKALAIVRGDATVTPCVPILALGDRIVDRNRGEADVWILRFPRLQ